MICQQHTARDAFRSRWWTTPQTRPRLRIPRDPGVESAFPSRALHTLLRWRSTEEARPEPRADANAAWPWSSTTSPTSNGPPSKLLGEGVRTAERRTSGCSATACSRSPVADDTRSKTSCRPAPSCNTSKCNDEVTGWLRRKRLDERAFLARHVELRMELPLTLSAEPDAEPAAPETNREAFPSDAVH